MVALASHSSWLQCLSQVVCDQRTNKHITFPIVIYGK